MGKYTIILLAFALIAFSAVNFAVYNTSLNALQSEVQDHLYFHDRGETTNISVHPLAANAEYSGDFYIENSAYGYAHLVATVRVILDNGTKLLDENIDIEKTSDDPTSQMQEMMTASQKFSVACATTTAQNMTIIITMHSGGFWWMNVYKDLPPGLVSTYERGQTYTGLALIALVLGILVLLLASLSFWFESRKRARSPDEPAITFRKEITNNKETFMQLFQKLVFPFTMTKGSLDTVRQRIEDMNQRYMQFFTRLKELGIVYELHPKNGLTTFQNESVKVGSEQWEYNTLIDAAHKVNRATSPNAMWIIVLFLVSLWGIVLYALWAGMINLGTNHPFFYIFMSYLAGMAVLMIIFACRLFGNKGLAFLYARTLLLLDPAMIRYLYEQGFLFPYADLRHNVT